jgi:signal peptidase II
MILKSAFSSFSVKSLISFLCVSSLVFLADRVTKSAAEIYFSAHDSVPVVKGIFHLTLVHNRGAAFGILHGGQIFFVVTTLACLVAIVWFLIDQNLYKKVFDCDYWDRWIRFSLALIFGGACGNLMDRLKFSYVIDFLDFRVWPVFNVADSAITIGGIIIFLKMFHSKKSVS